MAEVHVLVDGYARREGGCARVAGTVSLIRAPGLTAVVDPGMVAARDHILRPLQELGVGPDEVTDVILSHHHPDHTVNVALFPRARVHDHWAVYDGDLWLDRPAEGDPRATDLTSLHEQRARVLEVADLVVPGHGAAFQVTDSTPR